MHAAALILPVALQHGDDIDPFFEAEEEEMLRSRDAKRRHLAMAQQATSAQVREPVAALAVNMPLIGCACSTVCSWRK